LLDALSSPVRREILWMVWDQELPVGDIAAAFDVTAPTISQHLAVLRGAGLVTMRAEGNFRRYRARQGAFGGFEALLSHTGRWAPPDRLADGGIATVESDVVALSGRRLLGLRRPRPLLALAGRPRHDRRRSVRL